MSKMHDAAADLIITRAEVWTGDQAKPRAEAVAVLGDRIIEVGSSAEVKSYQGAHTEIIDAQGRLLLPGFNDAHVHFIDGGMQLDNVNLKDTSSPAEFMRRVQEQARKSPPGDWILGGGWDEQRWSPPSLPTREMLDAAAPGYKALLHRGDMHMALANSRALQEAGVTARTPDPVGGAIVRDSHGEPTGILKDAAIGCVARIIPAMDPQRRGRAAMRALQHAASLGVTSVQHMNPNPEDVDLYRELAENNALTTRIYAVPLESDWTEPPSRSAVSGTGSQFLRLGALKGFSDGSLGSATALFFEPYPDAPHTSGLLTDEMQPREAVLGRLLRADGAGMQLCLHAIGDRAVSIVLDLYQDIVSSHGVRDRRLRVEHAQHIAQRDFARFRALGVVASVQPYHAVDDGCWAGPRIGAQRLSTSYPYRTLLEHSVRLALGTDWYVAPLNPMLTLHAAVTRATLDGKHPDGWIPEQKLSMAEAVSAYTLGSAYAEFQEHEKGSITAGKLADMVLLNADIFRMEPEAARDVEVDATVVGGKVVYRK